MMLIFLFVRYIRYLLITSNTSTTRNMIFINNIMVVTNASGDLVCVFPKITSHCELQSRFWSKAGASKKRGTNVDLCLLSNNFRFQLLLQKLYSKTFKNSRDKSQRREGKILLIGFLNSVGVQSKIDAINGVKIRERISHIDGGIAQEEPSLVDQDNGLVD